MIFDLGFTFFTFFRRRSGSAVPVTFTIWLARSHAMSLTPATSTTHQTIQWESRAIDLIFPFTICLVLHDLTKWSRTKLIENFDKWISLAFFIKKIWRRSSPLILSAATTSWTSCSSFMGTLRCTVCDLMTRFCWLEVHSCIKPQC